MNVRNDDSPHLPARRGAVSGRGERAGELDLTGSRLTEHPSVQVPRDGLSVTLFWNGKPIVARPSDTVASALYAAGVRIFSRSVKYHRPRGLFDNQGLGSETLVTIDHEPNVRADRRRVEEGMWIEAQNAWPSVDFDLMAVNDALLPLLPNGFHYKMFHKPRWARRFFDRLIRRAAGLGTIDTAGHRTETRYEKRYRFPDICIVGAGPAGLAAARAALAHNRRVLLIDDDLQLGGHCAYSPVIVNDCDDRDLCGLSEQMAALRLIDSILGHANLEVLLQTTAVGLYEDNLVVAERGTELFKVRADSVIVATGASDRHLVFADNDRPGVMMARGVERLIGLHGVKPGRRAVVVTCHDRGYETAQMLRGAGTRVAAVVDARVKLPSIQIVSDLHNARVPIYGGETVHSANAHRTLRSVTTGDLAGLQANRTISCDLLVLAVGFKPTLGLLSMAKGPPRWHDERQIFTVDELPRGVYAAGDVNGYGSFARLYREGWEVGIAASRGQASPVSVREGSEMIMVLPADIESRGEKHFICKCMDITRAEAHRSIAEGLDQVETLKRYSNMEMGPCRGKTCYEAVARLAARDTDQGTGRPAAEPGMSSAAHSSPGRPADRTLAEVAAALFQPPCAPISLGVLAGRSRHLAPIRRTAMHDLHVQAGATFFGMGEWQCPHSYGDPQKEVQMVREGLAIIDVSTMGKWEIGGPDALALIESALPGRFGDLAVGVMRHSTICGKDGRLCGDGMISHLTAGRYYISTTTGNHSAMDSLVEWWITDRGLDVHYRNLSSVLASVHVTGQRALEFLQELVDIDLSNQAFSHLSCGQAMIANVPIRLFRTGFTGELGYDIHFPAEYGESLWHYFLERGEPHDLKPFGMEALRILMLEKGHLIPGIDTDGPAAPCAAGVGFPVGDDRAHLVGKAFLGQFEARGLDNNTVPYKLAPGAPIPPDGVVILDSGAIVGRVTCSRMSPTLGHGIGLARVAARLSAPGCHFSIRLPDGRDVEAEVLAGAAYDPDGVRLRA